VRFRAAALSPYLDGVVTGTEMRAVRQHLDTCTLCAQEYSLLQKTQQLLITARRPAVPPDLGLKLRLAISHEAALSRRSRYEGLRLRFENTFEAFMVPATAGLACAILIFWFGCSHPRHRPAASKPTKDVPLSLNNRS